MHPHARIGVFDSGVGGLELLHRLRTCMPGEDIYYFADTVNHPYGQKSEAEIARFLSEIIEGMLLRRVKLLVIACNTASVVFQKLPPEHPLKRSLKRAGVEVIPMTSGVALTELFTLEPRRVVIAATTLTIESGVYQRLMREHLPGVELRALALPEWVEVVEHPAADPAQSAARRLDAVKRGLAPLGDFAPDALFLGCTHFPSLTPEIAAVLGPAVRLVNPAAALSHFIRHYLDVRALAAPPLAGRAPRADLLFTNGPIEKLAMTLHALGARGGLELRQVDIRSDLSDKQVEVVGFGVTGKSLLRFLAKAKPARLVLRDQKPVAPEAVAALTDGFPVTLITGPDYLDGLEKADVIFRSPGVPADHPAFARARETGVPVMSDIDLFLRDAPGRKVAISGTNGKTTTTLLTERLFAADLGADAHLLGNIGLPVLDEMRMLTARSVSAIELSSFQLEELNALPVSAAILLNITPDHLDRHGGMLGYTLAKGRLLSLLTEDAFAIYNIDSEPIVNTLLPRGCRAKLVPFSRTRPLEVGASFHGADLVFRYPGLPELRLSDYLHTKRFVGAHNVENVCGAGLAAYLLGVGHDSIRRVLTEFSGVRYRIEHFARIKGSVEAYDDAKGTNPDATIKALEAMTHPVRLIAGGANKGFDFDSVAEAARGRVVRAYVFGEIAEALARELAALNPAIESAFCAELEDATLLAAKEAEPGEALLFSPACASPPGQKYVGRGDRFKACLLGAYANELPNPGLFLDDPLAHAKK